MTATMLKEQPEAGPSTGPHRMRIASGGSIAAYVKFALDFLQNNPSRPLVLHTRPPVLDAASSAGAPPQPRSTSTLQPCTLAAPRLISVAELIKREYMDIINGNGKGKGKHKAVGIWQYTKSGLVDPTELGLGLDGAHGDNEANGLARILEGKLKPKMTHYPFLEITLSTSPLGLEKQPDTSCQYVVAARHRNRKGTKEVSDQSEADVEMQDVGEDLPDTGVPVLREASTALNPATGKKSEGKKRKSKGLDAAEGIANKKPRAAA